MEGLPNGMPTFSDADLRLIAEALGARSPDRLVAALREDASMLEAALGHPDVRRAVLWPASGPSLIQPAPSPELFFSVLLAQAERDLAQTLVIPEWPGPHSVVPLFDAQTARTVLSRSRLRQYLAHLLASYVHVEAGAVHLRGDHPTAAWRRVPFHELDLRSMLRLAQAAPGSAQPALLCRAADLALFLAGLFPRHIVAKAGDDGLVGWERHGQGLYHAAAVGYEEDEPDWSAALDDLAEEFHPSRRALNFIAVRYLRAS